MMQSDELALLDDENTSTMSQDNESVISALLLQLNKFNEVDAHVQRSLQ